MNILKRILLVIVCLSVIIVPFNNSYAASISATPTNDSANVNEDNATAYFNQALDLILRRYKYDVVQQDLFKSTIEGLLKENPDLLEPVFKALFGSLDDYSIYYTEDELNSFLENMSGEFCGIGVLVSAGPDGLLISKVYDDSPAKDGELASGDIITHVGDIFLGGMDIELAKQNILGPENTEITITISRNGKSITKTLTRRKVVIDAGFYQVIEKDKIGYIQLSEFNDTAAEFVAKALAEFDTKDIKNVIMDLRSNPGGGLMEFVDVCSLFIPTAPVIHLEYKNPLKFTTLYSTNNSPKPKYNLAVLVNRYSASASEAFSVAVQDSGVGIVIGEKSFGKGTMQNIVQFRIGGGAKFTEAEYLSPNKRPVNKIGVTPDVIAPDKISVYEDSDLEPLTYERVLKMGDNGNDVTAVEERLRLAGYDIGVPDGVYDKKTYTAVKQFQKANNLYPYGVADFTTQLKLNSILLKSEINSDNSYKKAVEIFKAGNWESYKKDWSNSEK